MIKLGWKRKLSLILLLFGALVFLVLGITFNIILDAVIDYELKKELTLRPGTLGYKMWLDPPVPVSFGIYVFHIPNHEEVKQGLAMPYVVERGPYIYRMHLHKTDIERHDFNSTISYRQPERFIFDRESSVGTPNDTFTNINVPYITVATILRHQPAFIQKALYYVMKLMNEEAFITLSVHQIFWGYKDPVLELAYKVLKKFGIHIPLITGEFGFFMGKNNTDDGLYNVFSGIDGDFKRFLRINHWNGLSFQKIWSTAEANEIAGSAGSIYPPFVNSQSNLSMFDPYLMRVLPLEYDKRTSYKGVDALHFVVPYKDFANSTVDPRNAGYCTPNANYCIPSGAYNFSVVGHGAPVYVSMPHFCGADPYYFERVHGLKPNPEQHQPYYDVHPLTGVSLSAARRYQINIRTQSFEHIPDFKNLPVSYLPNLWIDGVANMDDKDTKLFRDEIQFTLDAMPYVRIAVFCLSVILIAIALLLLYCWNKKDKRKDQQEPLLSKDNTNGSVNNSESESQNGIVNPYV